MASKFQAQHHNVLAESLRDSYMSATRNAEREGIAQAAKDMASALRADNPQFDAEQWFAAIYRDL